MLSLITNKVLISYLGALQERDAAAHEKRYAVCIASLK